MKLLESKLREAPQMRYEHGEMTYSQTEHVLCSAPSLGSRQQGRKLPWKCSLCIMIERSYTKGACRTGQRYEKRIMVSCVRVSDKLKMMRQEGNLACKQLQVAKLFACLQHRMDFKYEGKGSVISQPPPIPSIYAHLGFSKTHM